MSEAEKIEEIILKAFKEYDELKNTGPYDKDLLFEGVVFRARFRILKEINKTKSRQSRIEKALKKFADLEENYRNSNGGDAVFAKGCVYVADLRNAREALKV